MSWDGNERRSINWDAIVGHMAMTNTKLESIHEDLLELRDKVKTQNGRIGKLENWRNYIVGGIAAIGTLLGFRSH